MIMEHFGPVGMDGTLARPAYASAGGLLGFILSELRRPSSREPLVFPVPSGGAAGCGGVRFTGPRTLLVQWLRWITAPFVDWATVLGFLRERFSAHQEGAIALLIALLLLVCALPGGLYFTIVLAGQPSARSSPERVAAYLLRHQGASE